MDEVPDWMIPYQYIEEENVEIDLEDPSSKDQRSLGHLENKLNNIVVEDRPSFLDEWKRITPLTEDEADTFNCDEVEPQDVDFDAAEAFDYCYRAVLREATIYLVHSLTSLDKSEYRPWSPHHNDEEPYRPPADLFGEVVDDIDLPDTPFKTFEVEKYGTIDALYQDLVESDYILLEENSNRRVITPRLKYISSQE